MNPSQPWTKKAQRTYSDWLFWLRIRSYPYSPCSLFQAFRQWRAVRSKESDEKQRGTGERGALSHLSPSIAFVFSRSFLLRTAPHYLNAWNRLQSLLLVFPDKEHFHSRGQHLCKFIGTKESVLHKKRSKLPQVWFVSSTFHCFGIQIGYRDIT